MNRGLLLLTVLVLLAGCSASKPLPVAKVAQEALSHNRAGLRAEEAGDIPLAFSELRESLRLYLSIDEREGAMVDLINLARLQRRGGNYPAALQTAQLALDLGRDGEVLRGEAALEQGLIHLAAGDIEAARTAARLALTSKESGALRGRALNLLGRVELLQGDLAAAKSAARESLAAHEGDDPRREAANSWRLLGDVALAGGEGDAAEAAYNEALQRDRAVGSSERVADDLFGLGQSLQQRGNLTQAEDALQRAEDAATNGGHTAKAAVIRQQRCAVLRLLGRDEDAQGCEGQREMPSFGGEGRPSLRGFSP